MDNKRVLLAFSGGIDSCFAAQKLVEQGAKVTAMTLDTYGDRAMVERARERAEQLGIDFMEVDVREEFESQIVEYFTSEYAQGRTPAPCTLCNSTIKWATLYEKAIEGGYDNIATGHYFRIEKRNGKSYIRRAEDTAKDQSYYLWMLSQEVLEMALTPMGDVIKRSIMGEGAQRESMGVCFLEGQGCGDFLCERCVDITAGEVVDSRGDVVGSHEGVALYTIGQKKGLSFFDNHTSSEGSVVRIDAVANRLTVGGDDELLCRNLLLSGCMFVDMNEAISAKDVSVKIRGFGRNPEGFCTIRQSLSDTQRIEVTLDHPAWAAAKGQPVLFYRGDLVLGGGFLEDNY